MIPTKDMDFMPKIIEKAKEKALEDPRHIHNILGLKPIRVEKHVRPRD